MEFKILDLFCGAGGMSCGMHKNPHFKTVVALDIEEKLAVTLKKNICSVQLFLFFGRYSESYGNTAKTIILINIFG